MTDRDEVAEHLDMAETTLALYQGLELNTDEAALLRGCLSALVHIGRRLGLPPEPSAHAYVPSPPYSADRYLGKCRGCGHPHSHPAHNPDAPRSLDTEEWRPCPSCHAPSSNRAHRKECRGIVAHPA